MHRNPSENIKFHSVVHHSLKIQILQDAVAEMQLNGCFGFFLKRVKSNKMKTWLYSSIGLLQYAVFSGELFKRTDTLNYTFQTST